MSNLPVGPLLMKEKGAVWIRVFTHNSSTGKWFPTLEEVMQISDESRYSSLGLISDKDRINGYFEFMIQYRITSEYNRWLQKKNPKETTLNETTETLGYHPIHVDFPGLNFSGLTYSDKSSCAFFDCVLENDKWTNAIGVKYDVYSQNTFPAFYNGSYVKTQYVELWMRYANRSIFINTCNINRRSSLSYYFFVVIIRCV